ncbi:PQQ-dependent sugar dehydrogenase [Hymenobacter sp.]|uniref:PQQ-dependent sugar dehydrogenase n=1 Tax=Hymenobacter sp. TaxID=1898978 RepID=UPI00286B9A36|nr:PQQ-dependent sugar dehydrogenase [Hymenobacter sp.]
MVLSASMGAGAQTFPAGFSASLVTTGIQSPTAMAFAPDGRIFACQQTGQLRVVKNGVLLPTPFVALSVNSSGERGLIGIALDPNFAVNQYIYLYYTLAGGANNRISRFTASGDVAAAGSEITVLTLDPLSSATNHNGGAMHFGRDGKLYVAVGDNANRANAQNLDSYMGKMLRINADGSVPAGNPYVGGGLSAQRQRIWSQGLRNPFTFAVQPGTDRIFVNDVGEGSWEEINDAGTSGRNFGWPSSEGYNVRAGETAPFFAYPHQGGFPDGTGCSITGGTFFNPSSTNYPAAYVGKYFYQDYCGKWINYVDPGSGTTPPVRSAFAQNMPGDALALQTGPDGNLYYLARNGSNLWKVVYTAGSSAPVITTQPASATATIGAAVMFSVAAAGTAPFSYQWQKNGANIAGATGSSYTIAAVAPADAGQYRAVVTNSVGTATSSAATLTVTALNNPPTAQILTPASGTTYVAGTEIQFSADATDPEDGPLPASAFVWQVDFYHDTHKHDGTPFNQGSKTGIFAIPNSGELADNVFYRLILTVTDAGGRQTTTFRDILPQKSTIGLATSPAGLQLNLDGTARATPASVLGVEGILRTLGAPSPQTVGGVTYEFVSWSNGGTQNQTIATPPDDATYTATFRVVPASAQAVASFTLINADTELPIAGYDPLPGGATLNLAALPTRNLSIRANTNPATVGSVRFGYDGNANYKLENAVPYAIAGDNGPSDYLPWTPAVGSHTLTATPFTQSGAAGSAGTPLTISFAVTDAALRPADNPANTTAGLNYAYYEGSGWSVLPDFGALTAAKTGTTTDVSLAPRLRNEDFAFRYTGYVSVPAGGVYTFYTTSDDGSQLFIGSTLVVNNDGLHSAREAAGSVGLRAGLHAITITFFERGGDEVLNVSYAGPGLSKTAVPAGALFRTNPGRALATTASADHALAVQLYPNPTRDAVTIRLQAATAQEARVDVHDALGRRVAGLTRLTHAGPNELLLSLDGLSSGLYTVTVQHGAARSAQRLVVAR